MNDLDAALYEHDLAANKIRQAAAQLQANLLAAEKEIMIFQDYTRYTGSFKCPECPLSFTEWKENHPPA